MTKLDLSSEGKLYLKSLRACFNWLSIGGDIVLKSGHTLSMVDSGGVGFKARRYHQGGNHEIIMQIDSDTSLSFLMDHARKMSEEDCIVMAANCALNSK